MPQLNTTFNANYALDFTPTSFLIRLGKREIFVCRDMRKRFYSVNPVIDCSTGVERGHLEILLLRRWLVILSKARG
jgi:hypothetical protein